MPQTIDSLVSIDASGANNQLVFSVLSTLKRYGICKINNLLDAAALKHAVECAGLFTRDFDIYRKGGMTQDAMTEKYTLLSFKGYAGGLEYVEQLFNPEITDISKTSLFTEIKRSALLQVMRLLATHRMCYHTARLRLAFPLEESIHPGGLKCHLEHTAYPGAHVIWTPLTEPPLICNRDVPGIGFLVRERPENEKLVHTYEHAKASEAVFHDMTGHGLSCERVELPGLDFHFYLPEAKLGDIILFDSFTPHFSHYPQSAHAPRASFDMRIFPEYFNAITEWPEKYRQLPRLNI